MREIMKIDSIPKALSFLTGMVSLGLLVYGIYGESYWSGFGLILLMSSLIVMASSPRSQIEISDQASNEKSNPIQIAQYPFRKELPNSRPRIPQVKEA